MKPSRLEIAIAAICVAGMAIAGYLVWVHYSGHSLLCLTNGGCEIVQASSYATFVGIPVAVLGLAGYIAIFGSLFIRGEVGRAVTAMLALCGFGFSAYLTYLELFTIEAICQWCVMSAVLMTVLMVLTMLRFWRYTPEELAGQAAPATDEPPTE